MAILKRTSTDFEANLIDNGTEQSIEVTLKLDFVSDGDVSKYIDENGEVDLKKILPLFVNVLNAAELVEI